MKQPIRFGIVGCGKVARTHALNLSQLRDAQLVAVTDIDFAIGRGFAADHNCVNVESITDLVSKDHIDAIIIATPHDSHASLASIALDAGLHVLVEKPFTLHACDAQSLIGQSDKYPTQVLAVDFNQRTWPLWQEVKNLIDKGVVGPLRRLNWTMTDWYRPQSYYDSGQWRGTWRGEGGGLVVNQLPHNLDLLLWFAGEAKSVIASLGIGKHHHIEVEDELHAIIEFTAGHSGAIVSSTGEPAGINRLEIFGTLGVIRVEADDQISVLTYDVPADRHIATASPRAAAPASTQTTIHVDPPGNDKKALLQNFVNAIRQVAPLIASARHAVASVELANGIYVSGWTGQRVELPAQPAEYARLLDVQRQRSAVISSNARASS